MPKASCCSTLNVILHFYFQNKDFYPLSQDLVFDRRCSGSEEAESGWGTHACSGFVFKKVESFSTKICLVTIANCCFSCNSSHKNAGDVERFLPPEEIPDHETLRWETQKKRDRCSPSSRSSSHPFTDIYPMYHIIENSYYCPHAPLKAGYFQGGFSWAFLVAVLCGVSLGVKELP